MPIMDAFAYHPYMERADLPPTFKHVSPEDAHDRRLREARLGCSARAFDGTAQEGSTLPLVYDEFGVEARIPAALLARRTAGTSPRRRIL